MSAKKSAIEQFELVKERFTLANINTRKENHGDEIRKGYDLKFVGKMHNSVLKKFHPDLCNAFYKKSPQADVESGQQPVLRDPRIGDISYDLEIPRTLLRVHDIDHADHDFVMGGGKTNAFKFSMMEGGSVEVSFRVQYSNPDEEEMLKLMRVEFEAVQISLACAEEEAKPDNFQQAELITKTPHSPARDAAEDMFKAPPTDLVLKPDDVVNAEFINDGVQPGDSGHGYAAQPDDDAAPSDKPKRVTKPKAEAPAGAPVKTKRVSRKSTAEVE